MEGLTHPAESLACAAVPNVTTSEWHSHLASGADALEIGCARWLWKRCAADRMTPKRQLREVLSTNPDPETFTLVLPFKLPNDGTRRSTCTAD